MPTPPAFILPPTHPPPLLYQFSPHLPLSSTNPLLCCLYPPPILSSAATILPLYSLFQSVPSQKFFLPVKILTIYPFFACLLFSSYPLLSTSFSPLTLSLSLFSSFYVICISNIRSHPILFCLAFLLILNQQLFYYLLVYLFQNSFGRTGTPIQD